MYFPKYFWFVHIQTQCIRECRPLSWLCLGISPTGEIWKDYLFLHQRWKCSVYFILKFFFQSSFKLCPFVLGNALLRRLVRTGVLEESKMKLDYVLGLKPEDFLERRLQTQVFKLGLAKSIHHARVLIRQGHIR